MLLLISLPAALGVVLAAVAAGSHLKIGFKDGAFNFDFKLATGDSEAATVLGLIALASGPVGIGLHVSRGNQALGEAAATSGVAGSVGFSDFAGALRRLTKSKTDVWLGGFCGGLGEHPPLPPWVWRLVFLPLICCYGTGVLLYVLPWICLPEPRQEEARTGTPSGTAASTVE